MRSYGGVGPHCNGPTHIGAFAFEGPLRQDLNPSGNMGNPHVFLNFFVRNDVACGTICNPLGERGMLEEDSSTGSDAAFFLAKWWLDCCKRDHKACRDFQGRPQLPDRIIDVGPSDGSREPYVREMSGVQRGDYVTLSHCWGSDLTFTTTKRNLRERERGIPLHSMPPTFKDAVTIARKLEIRYLWIDALCILQDSKSDWEVQAAEMASIYRNAVFTIAADNAADSSGGCFTQRDGYFVRPHELDPPLFGPTDVFKNYIRAHDAHTRDSTLVGRGWVLQEQLLSTRTLNYQSGKLSWRCCTSAASENHPGMRCIINADFVSQFQQSVLNHTWFHGEAPSQSSFSTVWGQVLMNYSQRSLTIATDRLAAIYGLAEALRGSYGLTYVAGLWKEQLQKDLLWVRSHSLGSRTGALPDARPDTAIAPSWSWASLNAPVKFIPDEMMMPVLEGVHIEARVAGSHSRQTGPLTIQSNVRVSLSDGKDIITDSGDKQHRVQWHPDGLIAPQTWIWFIAVARSYPKYAYEPLRAPAESASRPSSFGEGQHAKWIDVYCLGVVPTMRHPREFRRVGVASWPSEVFAGDGEDSLDDQDGCVTEDRELDEPQEILPRLLLPELKWRVYVTHVGYSDIECARLRRRPKRMKLRIV